MTVHLGIDLGLGGAIAAIDQHGTLNVHDMPTMAKEGSGAHVQREVDARELWAILRRLVPADADCLCVIEDVRMLQTDGRSTGPSLIQTRAIVETVLRLQGLPVVAVVPQRWQGWLGMLPGWSRPARKQRARELAATLYPEAAHLFKRVKDSDRADATCMAHYAMRAIG